MKTEAVQNRDRREDRAERAEKLGQACETLPAKTLADRQVSQRRKVRVDKVKVPRSGLAQPSFPLRSFPKGDLRAVTFRFNGPDAAHVFVAGSFNEWNTQDMPLARETNGEWYLRKALLPGRYEYRFIVDGVWRDDPEARQVPNPYGSQNSVLTVT